MVEQVGDGEVVRSREERVEEAVSVNVPKHYRTTEGNAA